VTDRTNPAALERVNNQLFEFAQFAQDINCWDCPLVKYCKDAVQEDEFPHEGICEYLLKEHVAGMIDAGEVTE
jgi:hypothetical protein